MSLQPQVSLEHSGKEETPAPADPAPAGEDPPTAINRATHTPRGRRLEQRSSTPTESKKHEDKQAVDELAASLNAFIQHSSTQFANLSATIADLREELKGKHATTSVSVSDTTASLFPSGRSEVSTKSARECDDGITDLIGDAGKLKGLLDRERLIGVFSTALASQKDDPVAKASVLMFDELIVKTKVTPTALSTVVSEIESACKMHPQLNSRLDVDTPKLEALADRAEGEVPVHAFFSTVVALLRTRRGVPCDYGRTYDRLLLRCLLSIHPFDGDVSNVSAINAHLEVLRKSFESGTMRGMVGCSAEYIRLHAELTQARTKIAESEKALSELKKD